MTYQEHKSMAIEEAIAFQNSFIEGKSWSWGELAMAAAYFEKLGKRYGLLKEFRENGIC